MTKQKLTGRDTLTALEEHLNITLDKFGHDEYASFIAEDAARRRAILFLLTLTICIVLMSVCIIWLMAVGTVGILAGFTLIGLLIAGLAATIRSER